MQSEDLSFLDNITPAEADAILMQVDYTIDRLNMEGSLSEFIKGAWHVIEPGRELVWNWHLDTLCAYLEALHNRKVTGLRRLIVNIPPGTMKSLVVSVFFPVWTWIDRPSEKFLCGSNEATLATRDALSHRRLVESDWFQKRWGIKVVEMEDSVTEEQPNVQISKDQAEKTLFANTHRGHRQSQGMTGKITGKRGDCLAGNMLVTTELGQVRIDDLCTMDNPPRVLSHNDQYGALEYKQIINSRVLQTYTTTDVITHSGRLITCTLDHRFYSNGEYEGAERINREGLGLSMLSEDQTVLESDKARESEFVFRRRSPIDVYDIEVEDNHNFFVEGILCHNCGIIDDPHDAKQTESDVQRTEITDAWDNGWSTRMNDPNESAVIVIMQRLHVKDLTGHLLAKKGQGWVLLAIPMRYDPDITFDAGKDLGRPDLNDPRTEEGELLFPQRFSEEAVRIMEIDLGPYGAAGQLQQTPNPKTGGELKREWLRFYKTPPFGGNRYIIVDPAGERKKGGSKKGKKDNTAMGVLEVGADGNTYLVDAYRDKLNLKERADILFKWHREHNPLGVGYERYGKDTDIVYLEERMEREGYRFNITELGGAMAKEDRIRLLIPKLSAGRIWLPETLYRTLQNGETVDIINQSIEQEYLPFPVGEYDDFWDMFARIEDPEMAKLIARPKKKKPPPRVRGQKMRDRTVGY